MNAVSSLLFFLLCLNLDIFFIKLVKCEKNWGKFGPKHFLKIMLFFLPREIFLLLLVPHKDWKQTWVIGFFPRLQEICHFLVSNLLNFFLALKIFSLLKFSNDNFKIYDFFLAYLAFFNVSLGWQWHSHVTFPTLNGIRHIILYFMIHCT